jgi:hypothetical protein
MCRVIITDTVISGSIVCFPVGSLSLSGAEQTAVTGDAVQPRIFWVFFFSSGKSAPLESHAGIYVNTARWMII